MTDWLINAEELARMFRVPPERIHEMAHRERLPFSWTTERGFCVHKRDVPAWKWAVRRAHDACSTGE